MRVAIMAAQVNGDQMQYQAHPWTRVALFFEKNSHVSLISYNPTQLNATLFAVVLWHKEADVDNMS